MKSKKSLPLLLLFSGVILFSVNQFCTQKVKKVPGVAQLTTTQLQEHITTNHYKNIVFDLTGVLLNVSRKFLLSEIGYSNMLWYGVRHGKNPLNVFKIMFDLMDSMLPTADHHYTYKEDKIPGVVCDWATGKKTSSQIKEMSKQAFAKLDQANKFNSDIEKKVMAIAVEKFFNPELLVEKTFTPMQANISLLKKLAQEKDAAGKKKYNLYLLSNLDNEVYALLLKKYPELFALFDGRIISAEVGSLKPDNKIYHELLEQFNLKPEECFFIDDQADNIVASQQIGIAGAQYI